MNATEVKAAAAGRWPEILSAVGGAPAEHLTGKHGPCPRCGGTDRFRFSDLDGNGSCYCNQCFSKGNGDGLAAIQWLCGCDFPTALAKVAAYLGMEASDNGRHRSNGSPKKKQVAPTMASKPTTSDKPSFESLKAAVNAYCKSLGKPAGGWKYVDSAGEPVGATVRWKMPDGTKVIRPVSRRDDGRWLQAAMPEPRPLYGLPALTYATMVWVPEGEPCCEAAISIGFVATTSAGGAKSPHKTDWRPLAGKDVIILPDADDAGRAYRDAVGAILTKLDPPATVKVVELPGLPPGGDIVDFLDAHDAVEPETLRARIEAMADEAPLWKPTPTATKTKPAAAPPPVAPGTIVRARDRNNYGTVTEDLGADCAVHFTSPSGDEATVTLPKAILLRQDGTPLDGSEAAPLPPIVPLTEIVATYPKLRPPVIHGLLRAGETANVVAPPKTGKSWLVHGLALSVASGTSWLDTFPCEPGRVLLVDVELHPENIAHRLPMIANAMGILECLDAIDVWPLRGQSADLFKLGPRLSEIEPGRYRLIVLDAWYRFLPPGLSENDNAAVMGLYNLIDGYAERLGAAWINVHHASKGDQGGKGVTDVGSGAGSQSRAADTHLVIRPHEIDGVAVVEAVVRSWPAVDKLAIRFDFPIWSLDRNADPTRLGSATARARRENRDSDQRELVRVAMEAGPTVKTKLRRLLNWGGDRFNRAFDPLEANGTFEQSMGVGEQGQKRILWVVKQDEQF